MSLSRRRFLSLTSSAAASGLGLAAFPGALAARKLDILVLGGTKFLGPATVDAALARGHKLTLFNRGKTNPHLYPNVEKLRGDRDPLKDEGLAALKDRRWDAVIDDCGYYPRMVRASAELLSACGQYVFISSISAYKDNTRENADETAAVATMEDPTLETMGPNFEYYGALKALCEQMTREVFKDRATIVRPGYIVGPLDPTDRFTYWVVRADRGGEMLAPGSPSDPVQVIDVRDLGEWIVRTVEKRAVGTFNACGPERRLGMGRMLDSALDATGRKARLVWVPAAFLREHGENGEGKLPIWAPYDGETKGFHTWSNARAVAAGLKFRPLGRTMKDTLAWFRTLPADRQAALKAGPSAEEEAQLVAAWRTAQAAPASS